VAEVVAMSEKPGPPADAERQRDQAIVQAERKRDAAKDRLSQREADYGAVGQLSPRLAYELERDRILADKACSERVGDAWREYSALCQEYFDRRLSEHDQAYEEHMKSIERES
jgi:hypothetical protein